MDDEKEKALTGDGGTETIPQSRPEAEPAPFTQGSLTGETGDEGKREERKEKREEKRAPHPTAQSAATFPSEGKALAGDEGKREERKEKREETGRKPEGTDKEAGEKAGDMSRTAEETGKKPNGTDREEGKKKRKVIPWEAIREDYIAHGGSYRELGTRYGIPFTQIGRRGRAEGWAELRAAADYKAMTETVVRASRARVRANLESLRNLNMLTEKLKNYCEEMLDDPTQRGKVLSSGRDWEGIAGMLERIEGIERRMMDIQTEAERRAEKREEKKLKLQEEKAGEAAGPKEIRVVWNNGEEYDA